MPGSCYEQPAGRRWHGQVVRLNPMARSGQAGEQGSPSHSPLCHLCHTSCHRSMRSQHQRETQGRECWQSARTAQEPAIRGDPLPQWGQGLLAPPMAAPTGVWPAPGLHWGGHIPVLLNSRLERRVCWAGGEQQQVHGESRRNWLTATLSRSHKGKQCLYLVPCVLIVLQCDPIGLDLRKKMVTDGQSRAGHGGMARATQPVIPCALEPQDSSDY